jgi:hypothetical protein
LEAAGATIERRISHGGGHTGWSRAWIINLFARLGNGDRCYENIMALLRNSMLPNLPPGCFVALKRYNLTGDNPNTIPFGQIFGVVVEDEHTGEFHGHIKVLRRHKDPELAKSFWIAHSFNTAEFDDFDIAIQQVHSLWIVKQHIVSDTIY